MTLRSRLAAALLTIAIILVIPLVIAVQSLNRLHRDAVDLERGEFAGSLLLGRLRESLFDLRAQETRLLLFPDTAVRRDVARLVGEADRLADSLDRYQLVEAAADVRRAVTQIAKWAPVEYEALLSGRKGTADSISATHIVPALDAAEVGIRAAERDLRDRTGRRVSESSGAIRATQTVATSSMLLALVVAAGVAIWLMRSITKPVVALQDGMRAVADGQLTYKLNYDSSKQHEFGQLARSFEEMTRQLAELEKLQAEFVSVASHELKTPINVIIGYLQLLDEGIYGTLTPKQTEIHKTLETQVKQLQRLVQQLLDVSRFEAGGGRLDPRQMELPKLLDELERTFHVLAVQRGVTFTVERISELPERVTWDKDRINEVLGNLLSNAFKFTEKGGQVTLSVMSEGNAVVMKVRDTGAGIPAEQLPRVFEKFYQADNQGKASAAGSGLGLAIVKQLVEAHGGAINCESTAGTGTTFTITIPTQVQRRSSSMQTLRKHS